MALGRLPRTVPSVCNWAAVVKPVRSFRREGSYDIKYDVERAGCTIASHEIERFKKEELRKTDWYQ